VAKCSRGVNGEGCKGKEEMREEGSVLMKGYLGLRVVPGEVEYWSADKVFGGVLKCRKCEVV